MTNTYLIHAWCDRLFITHIDPIEAASPAEAITIARRQRKALKDAAEECNGQYLWDEFAVYDKSGNELLHVLDKEARVHNAAPALLRALKELAEQADEDCPAEYRSRHFAAALEQANAVIAEATGRAA
jgi:aminoglycoside phosphotransferase